MPRKPADPNPPVKSPKKTNPDHPRRGQSKAIDYPLYKFLKKHLEGTTSYGGRFSPAELAKQIGTTRQNLSICLLDGKLTPALAWKIVSIFPDLVTPTALLPHVLDTVRSRPKTKK